MCVYITLTLVIHFSLHQDVCVHYTHSGHTLQSAPGCVCTLHSLWSYTSVCTRMCVYITLTLVIHFSLHQDVCVCAVLSLWSRLQQPVAPVQTAPVCLLLPTPVHLSLCQNPLAYVNERWRRKEEKEASKSNKQQGKANVHANNVGESVQQYEHSLDKC